MTISILHPSYGRPDKSYATIDKWWLSAAHQEFLELIVSVDSHDPKRDEYANRYQPGIMIEGNNGSVVEATNRAAKISTGDIMIYVSDDFEPVNGWDVLLRNEFEKESGPLLLKVDDCLQKFEAKVLTIPVMNRQLYDKLGYFWHPDYKSMFVDEDLWWTCHNMGAMKLAPHIKFEHRHVSVGKAPDDLTYQRSAANWNSGKATFLARKAAGFPLNN